MSWPLDTMNTMLIGLAILCSIMVWGGSYKSNEDEQGNERPYIYWVIKGWYIPIVLFLVFKGGVWLGTN